MTTKKYEPLRQFRTTVYQMLRPSRDAAFEMIDAIAASRDARSAVEVSLSPTMKRKFSSIHKGLERTRINLESLRPCLVKQAEASGRLVFNGCAIYALDHTPYPRKSAPTVFDRGYVHGANGRVIGHQYSLLGRVMYETSSWVGIVDCERIATHQQPVKVGAEQVARLKQTATTALIVTADSEYPTEQMLDQADERTFLLIRLRGSNKLYGQAPARRPGQRGASLKHGPKIKLNDEQTLDSPVYRQRIESEDGGWTVISLWQQMHFKSRPHQPVSVIRVESFQANGKRRFERPLWLLWTGPTQIDWHSFWKIYLKRFCLECVHQFAKNSLSWTRGRFGYTSREERWTWLVILAYWQLLLAAPLAREVCRPWEKSTPRSKLPTPARVQRDYLRIFVEIGSPTRSPKVRGIPPGRRSGFRPMPRPRFQIVYKGRGSPITT